jgi:hypothetical protein
MGIFTSLVKGCSSLMHHECAGWIIQSILFPDFLTKPFNHK